MVSKIWISALVFKFLYTSADIPECSLHLDNCSQICIEEQGGYGCSCRIGYTLKSDKSSCAGNISSQI